MKPIKNLLSTLFLVAVFITLFGLLHAQEADQSMQSLTDWEVMLQALEATTPMPASTVTDDVRGFYSIQHPDWPPLPGDISGLGLNVWPMGGGIFVLDDRDVDYVAISEAAEAAKLEAGMRSLNGGGMQMMSLITDPGSNSVYLTNLIATLTNDSITVTFDIAGGTNGFAYDIYSTTNLANSPVYSTWTWLGQGYTTNRYTFTNQPLDYAFYILAIPRQTMVVAWGDNSKGQCDVPAGLTNAIDVAAGYKFSLALKADGTVTAWGDNTRGETNVPVDLTNAIALAAGTYHAVVLKADGTVVTWGEYSPGDTNHSSVSSAPTNADFVAVAAGIGHDLGLKADGTVVTWGLTNEAANYVPTNLPGVKAIASGVTHNVALLTNGTVVVWGYNGAIFDWNITNVPAGLSNVVAIAAGDYHTLALKSDGTVTAWGAGATNSIQIDNYGQSMVPAGLSNVVAVAGGGFLSMALQADGTVILWGDNTFGQKNQPVGSKGVKAMAAGGFHGLAVVSGQLTPFIVQEPVNQFALVGDTVTFSSKAEGFAYVQYQWQFNGVNITDATNATLTLTNVQSTNEGDYQVVISTGAGVVTSDTATFAFLQPPQINSVTPALGTTWITNNAPNTVVQVPLTVVATDGDTVKYPLSYQWSFNGMNDTNAANGPTYPLSVYDYWPYAALLEGNYAVTVSNAAGSTNVGTWNIRLLLSGMVAAWGDDTYGQGDRPVTLTNTMALAAGAYHSVAVRDDGTIIQWGNYWGGGTNFTSVGSPPTNSNFVAVAAGIDDTIALTSDGTVIQWGSPDTAATNNFPTNLAGVKAISAGWYRNLALLTNGTIVDWGYFAALLGLDQRVPADLTNVTAIACGAYHCLAVRSDGTVASWGYNDSGQTNVPAGLSNVVAVAGGGRHSLALKADGKVVAWGDDTYGQCNVPTGLSNVMAIAAGYFDSAALKNDGTVVAWGDNTYGETNVPGTLTQIKLIAAGGYHTLATMFSPLVQYPVDVTKDLLLIYNSNSADSSNVCAYYLAHRPMVANANVLGVACDVGELTTSSNCDAQIVAPVLNWLTNNRKRLVKCPG